EQYPFARLSTRPVGQQRTGGLAIEQVAIRAVDRYLACGRQRRHLSESSLWPNGTSRAPPSPTEVSSRRCFLHPVCGPDSGCASSIRRQLACGRCGRREGHLSLDAVAVAFLAPPP